MKHSLNTCFCQRHYQHMSNDYRNKSRSIIFKAVSLKWNIVSGPQLHPVASPQRAIRNWQVRNCGIEVVLCMASCAQLYDYPVGFITRRCWQDLLLDGDHRFLWGLLMHCSEFWISYFKPPLTHHKKDTNHYPHTNACNHVTNVVSGYEIRTLYARSDLVSKVMKESVLIITIYSQIK